MAEWDWLLRLEGTNPAERHVFWRSHGPDADRRQHEARLLERYERYRRVEELTSARCDTQPLPRFSVNKSTSFGQAEQLASNARRSMDLGGRPAMSLAEVLQERFGVKLFLDDLGGGGSAACVRTDSDAAVLLHRHETPWRQRYSLAHELFHLVTWDAVLDAWPHGNQRTTWPERVEKLANVFASALLLPSDDLRAEFQSRFEGREASHPEVVNMARAYGVSTEALLWRLRSLGLISEDAGPETARRPVVSQDGPGKHAEALDRPAPRSSGSIRTAGSLGVQDRQPLSKRRRQVSGEESGRTLLPRLGRRRWRGGRD